MTTTYETGATSPAVNDLILFADNTRELAKLRDEIYMQDVKPSDNDIIVKGILQVRFNRLFYETIMAYKKEFPNDYYLTRGEIGDNVITYAEQEEFCKLYADDFDNWKREHGI